ncbi:MAG: hypothetical protein ACI9IA_002127 [Enterobacterales bacterium]|jgi:hypothetical protein
MNSENPLENLKDIHLPEAVSAWPPAPGWWILAFLMLGLLSWSIWTVWKRYQQKHLLRVSIATLEQIEQDYEKHQDPQQLIRQYSSLLRRISLALFSRSEVASLTGEAWLAFLDERADTTLFNSEAGYLLLNAPYQRPEKTIEHLEKLTESMTSWVQAVYRASSKKSVTKVERSSR